MIINNDGGYGLLDAYIGGPAAEASWLCPKVGCHLAQCCIHHVNGEPSELSQIHNRCAMTAAPLTLSFIIFIHIRLIHMLTERNI